jgi:hypothetical protein
MKIIIEEKLEETLVANWTQFCDISLLRKFVQNEIQSNMNSLIIVPLKKSSINTNSISLSRFYSNNKGYFLWIDFVASIKNKVAEGTIEAFLPYGSEDLKKISINGNLYYS